MSDKNIVLNCVFRSDDNQSSFYFKTITFNITQNIPKIFIKKYRDVNALQSKTF